MKQVTLLVAIMMISGCALVQPKEQPKTPEVRVIDTACTWVKELTFGKSDTEETKRQIIEHDKAVRKNCPKK